MPTDRQVTVGTQLIFRAILMLLGVGLLYVLRDIVVLLLLAIIFAAALNPGVSWLTGLRLPRALAVVLMYMGVLAGFVGLLFLVIPPFVDEVNAFTRNFPSYVARAYEVASYLDAHQIPVDKQAILPAFRDKVTTSLSNIFATTIGVVSGLVSFIIFFFLSLYLSLEENGIEKFFLTVAPKKYQERSRRVARRIQSKISQWMVGQFFVMLTVFLMYWAGLLWLDVPYALLLALVGGLFEAIPYAGPILAAVPAVAVGFAASPVTGLYVLLFYTVAHQIEGHAITPQIMKRAVGLNPVMVILALLVGLKLGGILGVILAVPMATVVTVFIEEFGRKQE